MASIDRMNLLDVALRLDPDRKTVARIVEKLEEMNPMVEDAPAIAGNAPLGNVVTRRSSEPTVDFGRINEGYTRSKSSVEKHTDTMGIILAMSDCDRRLEKVYGGKIHQMRFNEDMSFMQSISKLIALTMLYGDELTNEAAFTGLQARLEVFNTGITSSQVAAHHAAPSGSDYGSIYVVDWGEEGACVIYPEGSTAGVDMTDLGIQQVYDDQSKPFSAWVTEFMVVLGIGVKDNRHIARLANIDISQAGADVDQQLTFSMMDLLSGMPTKRGLKRVIYTTRKIKTAWKKQIMRKSNVWFSYGEWNGEKEVFFDGNPVRTMDQQSEAESLVS